MHSEKSIEKSIEKSRKNNKEKISLWQKEYYKKNKDKIKKRCSDYAKNNREKRNKLTQEYRKLHPHIDIEYRKKNKDKIKAKRAIYIENNKEKIRLKTKEYREKNKEKEKIRHKIYAEKNKEKIKIYAKQKRDNPINKEKVKKWRAEYGKKNRDKINATRAKWRKENLELHRERSRAYRSKRYKTDERYRISILFRLRIKEVIRKKYRKGKTMDLLGCTLDELIKHFESKFTPRMNWDNQGSYWHVDHIIPCSAWDLKSLNAQQKCFNYKNLQPMDGVENVKKSDNVDINIIMNMDIKTRALLIGKWKKASEELFKQ